MGGSCNTHGREVKCIYDFMVKPERKSRHGKLRSSRGDNIKVDLKEMI
jgi:hypothetical protein